MVLILLSWLYVFFTSISVGTGFSRLFRIRQGIVITTILGLFAITILASFWAIFGPINIGFHIFLLVISLISGVIFKSSLMEIIKDLYFQIASFSLSVKALFTISSLLILAQSATLPFIVDNETYYIQTIKWLNEYGLVPGLANLHLFLGQTSGWHITQSVYSFSFLYDRFNDLNGYLLLIVNFWAFGKLHSYFTNGKQLDLIFGLLPVSYVFLFQFISTPSPDLPVYMLSFLAFSIYTESKQHTDKESFTIITILVFFAFYIKITAAVLLILPFFILVKHFVLVRKKAVSLGLFLIVILSLFVVKNVILTGYLLYPFGFLATNSQHAVQKEIMGYFFSNEMMHSFYMGFGSYQDATVFYFLKQYFLHSGIDSIIGIATILTLIISPFIIAKYYPKQGFGNIYFTFIILLLLLVFSSPQYRFYIYFTLFFGLVLLSILLSGKKRIIIVILSLSLFLSTVLVFVPISFGHFTTNKMLANNSTLHTSNILIPEPISKQNLKYSNNSKGNLNYYSPMDPELFWITGNGQLPCVTEKQLNYFETNFHVVPQMIGNTLKDGFYAKNTKSDD